MRASRHLVYWSQLITVILLFTLGKALTVVTIPSEEPLTKTIYIDNTFDEYDEMVITDAAEEWRQATKGRVNYTVVRLPVKDMDLESSIVMVKITEYNPEVLYLDKRDGNYTLAFYNQVDGIRYIALVEDRIPENLYREILLHEFGHSLGLQHPEKNTGQDTLMYPTTDHEASYITDTDLYNFCLLHHCHFWELHDQKEPSHP